MVKNVFDDDFKPKANVKKQPRKERLADPTQLTTYNAVGSVIEIMKDSGLEVLYLHMAEPYLDFIAQQQQITTRQALMLSLMLERYYDHHLTNNDLAQTLNCELFDLLGYQDDIETLVRRRFLRSDGNKDSPSYRIPREVLNAVRDNRLYMPVSPRNLKPKELLAKIGDLFEQLEKEILTSFDTWEEIYELFENNSHLQFVKRLDDLRLNDEEKMLLVYICHAQVNLSYDSVCDFTLRRIFEPYNSERILANLCDESYPLFEKGLIEHGSEDGLVNTSTFRLTKYARQQLLGELGIGSMNPAARRDIIRANEIRSKQLFYPQEVAEQTMQLQQLLSKETYQNICQRLEERGMRKSLTCLFYGQPGTGKTETVLQIARQIGRNIFQVDLSQLRNMYVGESEKLVKGVFDRYRDLCREEDEVPILLFNEADGIFSRRSQDVRNAVDKMENTLQNIILQEMETLEGILIATTNLTDNLDSAFDRRFLYKLHFEQPDAATRQNIWQSMMPEMTESQALELSQKYALSGGQIENVVRKAAIDSVLYGKTPSAEIFRRYCQRELQYKSKGTIIGF